MPLSLFCGVLVIYYVVPVHVLFSGYVCCLSVRCCLFFFAGNVERNWRVDSPGGLADTLKSYFQRAYVLFFC